MCKVGLLVQDYHLFPKCYCHLLFHSSSFHFLAILTTHKNLTTSLCLMQLLSVPEFYPVNLTSSEQLHTSQDQDMCLFTHILNLTCILTGGGTRERDQLWVKTEQKKYRRPRWEVHGQVRWGERFSGTDHALMAPGIHLGMRSLEIHSIPFLSGQFTCFSEMPPTVLRLAELSAHRRNSATTLTPVSLISALCHACYHPSPAVSEL